MTTVVLGNRHASDSSDNGATRFAVPKGKRATKVDIPADVPLATAILAITGPGGIWATHTAVTDPETGELTSLDGHGKPHAPAWIASDDPALASVLASHYGGVEIRDLEEN